MVSSGLVDRTDVSHYRLSLHLTLAFIIFILLLWNYLKYKYSDIFSSYSKLPKYIPFLFLLFILIQISIGALVSGLDAGKIYQSWPLMNSTFFPDDSQLTDLFTMDSLETPSIVQFIHRNIAYFIIILFSFIATIIYANKDKLSQVFSNLINKSLSYSPQNSAILIEQKNIDNNVVISFFDQGPGINTGLQDKIFERFYTDREVNQDKHSGVGLSIAKKIIETFSGSLELNNVKSEKYFGACFSIILPLID